MASLASPSQGASPEWTVAAVALRLGVAPATLRSWSRRYGIGPAEHLAGTHRRYSDADVAELETMRRLADDGMVLASAAAVARRHRGVPVTDHDPGPGDHPERQPEVTAGELRALVAAARRLEAGTLVHSLHAGLDRRDVVTTWDQLCRPALAALDHPGLAASCLDGALVLASAITTSLHQRFPATVLGTTRRPSLLACAPGEDHHLALDVLLAAMTERDLPAQTLAPGPPVPALLHAIETTRPTSVLVWAQRPATARATPLRRLLPHADTVAVGGPGWSTLPLPDGVVRLEALGDAVAWADAAARSENSVRA